MSIAIYVVQSRNVSYADKSCNLFVAFYRLHDADFRGNRKARADGRKRKPVGTVMPETIILRHKASDKAH